MRFGIEMGGLDDLMAEFAAMPELAKQNTVNAMVIAANDARNVLRDATKGPRSGRVSREVGEAWTVVPDPTGASVINTHEIAAYLEFGVGIYNEGPGLKGPIVARKGKALRFEIDGKVIFVRSVKGFKGVAMVRSNFTRLKKLAHTHLDRAAQYTAEGQLYGQRDPNVTEHQA